ncbi:hypothetical protein H113_07508, partial [Trichophyton rubrum MR1459]
WDSPLAARQSPNGVADGSGPECDGDGKLALSRPPSSSPSSSSSPSFSVFYLFLLFPAFQKPHGSLPRAYLGCIYRMYARNK